MGPTQHEKDSIRFAPYIVDALLKKNHPFVYQGWAWKRDPHVHPLSFDTIWRYET